MTQTPANAAARTPVLTRVIVLLTLAALTLAVLPAIAPGSGTAEASACQYKRMTPRRAGTRRAARSVACLINHRRRAHRVHRVRHRSPLRHAARGHTGYMIRHRCFSHQCSGEANLMDRVRREGYFSGASSYGCGEDLATQRRHRASPRNIVKIWMDSPEHRAVLLSGSYHHIGIGVVAGTPSGSNHGGTYTADFCYRNG